MAAGGLATGSYLDAGIGFADGGLLTGFGADVCKKLGSGMGKRLTEGGNTSPGRIMYFGTQ